jgi:hypothetical protein
MARSPFSVSTKAPNKKRGRATRPDKKAVDPAGVPPATASPPAPAGSDPTMTQSGVTSLPAPLFGDIPPSARNELGRWIRGQSGNVKGRPKGLRNYVTRERLALEAALRSYISDENNLQKLLGGIDRMFDIMARGGDKEAIGAFKVLADKLLTAPKESGDSDDGPRTLTVVIAQARGGDSPPVQIIHEGEFTEVQDEEDGTGQEADD